MSKPELPADPRGGWLRRSRRYSPFDRSPGLRRLPDDAIAFAFILSVLLHAALIVWVVRVTQVPTWSVGADMSLVSIGDLVPSVPAGSQVPATDQDRVAPADRSRTGRSAPSVPPAAASRGSVPTSAAAPPARPVRAAESARSAPPAAPFEASPQAPSRSAEASAASPEPAGPAQTGPVALLSAAEVDNPLDPGPPEPPRPTPATSEGPAPARSLTAVPVLRVEPLAAPALPASAAELQPAPEPAEPTRQVASAPAPAAAAPTPSVRPVKPIPAAPSRSAAVDAIEKTRSASPLGLGLGSVRVKLDGPKERVTDRPRETISGKLSGGPADQVVLYVNGIPMAVSATERTFEVSVSLKPGSNNLRVVATGPAGPETEDGITVDYVTPATSTGIVLVTPSDGLTLGAEDPPIVIVEGQVADPSIGSGWVVVNDRRVPVSIRDGRFRHILVVSEPLLRLWVETAPNGGTPQRSQAVTVHRAGASAPTGILVVQWPSGLQGSDVEVSATWRAQADRIDAPAQTVMLPAFTKPFDGMPTEVFYLRGLKPGVYTLAVRSRGAASSGDVLSTFYLPDRTGFTARPLVPARLNGGRTVLAKVLLPYGVLWSQDDWFSGLSESVDTVTKFRVPEGISWVERKVDLQ